jgi:hypothetical protein
MNRRRLQAIGVGWALLLIAGGCNRPAPDPAPAAPEAGPAGGPPAETGPPPDAAAEAELIRAWERAGAEVRWVRPDPKSGTVVVVPAGQRRPDDVLTLTFFANDGRRPNPGQWPAGLLAGLPRPARSFRLEIRGPALTDDGLKEVAGFHALEALSLRFTTRVTGAGLRHLKGLPNLRSINLGGHGGVELTDDVVRSLRELGLLHCWPLAKGTGPGGRPRDAAGVVSFELPGGKVTEAAIPELREFPNLAAVSFRGRLTPAGIGELVRLPAVTAVTLSGPDIPAAGLKDLKGLTGLRSLALLATRVGDAGLREVSEIGQLEELELNSTGVTDDGVRELKRLKSLRRLRLNLGVQPADGGGFVPVHERAINELRAALPGCTITAE